MTTDRNAAIDRLALGSSCPECSAWADEPCKTRRAMKPTSPHSRRIDRACKAWEASQAIRERAATR